jgi:uncharacterized protein YfaS (alpha-2-macroglobulin family)
MKLKDAQDNEVHDSGDLTSEKGTLAFTFKIPDDFSGGVYQIEVTSGYAPKSFRSVRVNQDTTPELYITGDFDKTNYSPGDYVN